MDQAQDHYGGAAGKPGSKFLNVDLTKGWRPMKLVRWTSRATPYRATGAPTLATVEKGKATMDGTAENLVVFIREFRSMVAGEHVDHRAVRPKMHVGAGRRPLEWLATRKGESDLSLIDGNFYLLATGDMEAGQPDDVQDVMGLDLGLVNIATEKDGTKPNGSKVNSVRKRRSRQRKRLPKKGTTSAKRVLKAIRRKEALFSKDVNHQISKRLVHKAKRTNSAIVLEDLKGLRDRVRLRRSQRYMEFADFPA